MADQETRNFGEYVGFSKVTMIFQCFVLGGVSGSPKKCKTEISIDDLSFVACSSKMANV